jgi:hypothetical protein
MDKISEIEKIIETQIHEPAIRELRQLHAQGLINRTDVDRFSVSVQQYKVALFSQYDGLDDSVRYELLKSLLIDYKATIDGLVQSVAKRSRLGDSSKAEDKKEDKKIEQPTQKSDQHSKSTPKSLEKPK